MKKIVNVYIVYDLDAWPRNPSNNFTFKNCLFEATDVVKSSDTEKYVCSGYGTTFDSAGSWNFVNEFARKDLIFGEDNTSSCHSNNHKNKKKFSTNFIKANTKFCLRLRYNADNSFLFVNGKEVVYHIIEFY